MQPRITMITLGVRDLPRAVRFYHDGLGWPLSSASNENVAFLRTGGAVLGLYPWDALAEDATVDAAGSGFRGMAIAHNVETREQVAAVLEQARAAGAEIVKVAQDVFWGGHSGYFADPDGHLWEVAWNPHAPLGPRGEMQLPE
ncbi:MAG: VOC family protein [Planctomycetales bacterium]|nr:VOC family protein [Planctomycetales bacterium]